MKKRYKDKELFIYLDGYGDGYNQAIEYTIRDIKYNTKFFHKLMKIAKGILKE